jgi:hypothetical protein
MEGQAVSYYRILEMIGEGGMEEVPLAEDTSLQRDIVLKFLRWRRPRKTALEASQTCDNSVTRFRSYSLELLVKTWTTEHTCSIPKPVILAGTALLRPGQQYIQHSLWPE